MKQKIMIVDDNSDVVDAVKTVLELEGYDTVEAYSGRECLNKVRNEKPDLIILDILMPGMDGWQVLHKLNKEKTGVPVIILSVKDDRSDEAHAAEIGVRDYIVKPFSPKDLISRIKKVLKSKV